MWDKPGLLGLASESTSKLETQAYKITFFMKLHLGRQWGIIRLSQFTSQDKNSKCDSSSTNTS